MPRDALTALDWIGALLAGALTAGLFGFPLVVVPTWRATLAELGGPIPGLTRLVLEAWFTPALGVVAVGLLVAAGTGGLTRRRAAVVAAFMWAAACLAMALVALYLPFFQLAGNIE